MLEQQGIGFNYRDYRSEPLTAAEIRRVLSLLQVEPKDVLRRRDRAFRELRLSGNEDKSTLIAHMAAHPTLLERPIGVLGNHAVVGRPIENLLALVD